MSFPGALLSLTKTSQHVSFLYSLPFLLQVMRLGANSNQLIFQGARVLAFVKVCVMSSKRLQLYNRELVMLSSSSSPLFILILCEKTAGLFFFFAKAQKLSLHQPTGMRATLQIAYGSPASRVRAGDEIALGLCFGEGTYWGGLMLYTPHINKRHSRVKHQYTQTLTEVHDMQL